MIPLRARLRHRVKLALGWKCYPLHNDQVLIQLVDQIFNTFGIKSFVETGTFLGFTSRHVAKRNPGLRVLTVECNPDYHELSRISLSRYPNVTQYLGDSAEVLEGIVRSNAAPRPSLFFLDAHWEDYLPLPHELGLILDSPGEAVVLIDDFQVPNRPEYGFDAYHGQPIGLDLVRAYLNTAEDVRVFFPDYDQSAAHPQRSEVTGITGYALLFKGYGTRVSSLQQLPLTRQCLREWDGQSVLP